MHKRELATIHLLKNKVRIVVVIKKRTQMNFKSPLSSLSETLCRIKESAVMYQKILKKNEAATRTVLIDPVLRALGWDTANTNMVEVEKTTESLRADYALYDGNGIARIIVEAKALGSALDQKAVVMALVDYAFGFQLNDVFLTDGIIWHHYEDFHPGNLSPKHVINLSVDDPIISATYFVQHLDAAKYWPMDQGIDEISQRLDQLESTVADLQRRIMELGGLDPRPIPNTDKFVALEKLENIAGTKPSRLRLPSGTVLEISTWIDVLRETCKFVLGHNLNLSIPHPDSSGKKVSLFSYEKPANKVSYVTEEYRGEKIYIYLNYDSYHCVENALFILKECPEEFLKVPPAVEIKK
ncbi:MAG TPA: hypothetical protein PLA26_01050 [Anaerolineaceae bacterium]|nr:hypothetical protein [Anaerolineaceae bacterium]HOT25768.1 hypothetical protein [Anaerolineaceae bacterium]HQK03759.1 hypothetical protein [Anaerolineaceae bacterium]HQL27101.1 hypothetical protein [Anaerolineaceae bacterium]